MKNLGILLCITVALVLAAVVVHGSTPTAKHVHTTQGFYPIPCGVVNASNLECDRADGVCYPGDYNCTQKCTQLDLDQIEAWCWDSNNVGEW